jgi:Protein of unknown function (DUF1353)/Bacterial SH3 domain
MKKLLLLTTVLAPATTLLPNLLMAQEKFVAHISSHRSMESARKYYAEIQPTIRRLVGNASPHIHRVDAGIKGVWFRLQIGPPVAQAQAMQFCGSWRQLGHSFCKVVTPFALGRTRHGFSGRFLFEPSSDGRNMKVVEQVRFVDQQGRIWDVPAGTVTDGASIPSALWSLVGAPFSGKYRKAAVIHDHFVRTKYRSWSDTHNVFHEAMIDSGVSKSKAMLMWAAVYRFGPRWFKSESACWGTCAGDAEIHYENVSVQPRLSQQDLRTIKRIVRDNPGASRSDIEQLVEEHAFKESVAYWRGTLSRMTDDRRTKGIEQMQGRAPWFWRSHGHRALFYKKRYYKVVNVPRGEALALRAGPGTNQGVHLRIPSNGTRLKLVGECRGSWCPVTYRDIRGWVNARNILFDTSLSVRGGSR